MSYVQPEQVRNCISGFNGILHRQKTHGISDIKKTAKGFAQQFLNRFMFLYFIQKKGWLNDDGRFVWSLVRRYKKLGRTRKGIYKDWFEPLFFYSFNNNPIQDSYANIPLISSRSFLMAGLRL